MGSIIGGELGADMIQARGQASWADLVWIETSKYAEGNTLPPALVSTLTWSEVVPLLLALAGSVYSGVCFIAPCGADISNHYFFGVSVSNGAIVDCINEQLIMCGPSLSVACSTGSGLQLSPWLGIPWRAISY